MAAKISSFDMVLFVGDRIKLALLLIGDGLLVFDLLRRSATVGFPTGVDDLKPELFSGLMGENDASSVFLSVWFGEDAKNL